MFERLNTLFSEVEPSLNKLKKSSDLSTFLFFWALLSVVEERSRENLAEQGRARLLKIVRKKQLEFLGHVMRKEGLEDNVTLTGKIEGKRSRGKALSDVLGKSEQMDGGTTTGGRKTNSPWTGTVENN